MKKNITLKIAIMTLLCFVIAAALAKQAGEQKLTNYWQDVSGSFDKRYNGKVRNIEKSFEDKGLTELEINSTVADIKIEKSKDAAIHLFYKDKAADGIQSEGEIAKIDGEKIKFELDNFVSTAQHFDFNFKNGMNFNIAVDEANARLQIPDNIKKIMIKSVSGDIEIVNINVDNVMVDSVSGNIKIQGDVKAVKSETVSGDIKFSPQTSSPEAKLSTTSGDVKVTFKSEPDISLNFETTSGEIGFAKELGRPRVEGSLKDFKLGQGQGHLDIATVSGDVKIATQLEIEK